MRTFNQSDALVLIAKYKMFSYHFSKMIFILFYIQQFKQAHLIDWRLTFYILKKLQLCNQYLVMKMQPNTKKTSNIASFLLFKIAKRFARNLFALPLSHKHLQGNGDTVNLSLFSFYLSIRNVKHRRGLTSLTLQGYINYYSFCIVSDLSDNSVIDCWPRFFHSTTFASNYFSHIQSRSVVSQSECQSIKPSNWFVVVTMLCSRNIMNLTRFITIIIKLIRSDVRYSYHLIAYFCHKYNVWMVLIDA